MGKMADKVRPLHRFVRTTGSDHDSPIFPNLAAATSRPVVDYAISWWIGATHRQAGTGSRLKCVQTKASL
jgi:hypothetical protein